MSFNPKMWKFDWKNSKDGWIILLAVGLIILVLVFPSGRNGEGGKSKGDAGAGMGTGTGADILYGSNDTKTEIDTGMGSDNLELTADLDSTAVLAAASTSSALTYEQQMEQRLEQLLSNVDGVGKVKVMIVLESSEEKVWRVDHDTSYSTTREADSNGGTRYVDNQDVSEETILIGGGSGSGSSGAPLLEKELRPVISGVVVSATGGGSPQVQAEISAAVEALFGVPSHKIKVLKMKSMK